MMKIRRGYTWENWAFFSEHLGDLLSHGVPLVQALMVLEKDSRFRMMPIPALLHALQQGDLLSEAMKKNRFPLLLVALTKAAESYGGYPSSMQEAGRYYHQQRELHRHIVQVAFYPLLVFSMVLFSFFFFLFFVLPGFESLYDTVQVELPVATQHLLRFGDWLRSHTSVLGGIFLVFFVTGYLLFRHPGGFLMLERLGLQTPLLRVWLRLRYTQFFASQTGLLLQAGVPIKGACEVVREASLWPLVETALEEVITRVNEGATLSASLQAQRLWDPGFSHVMRVAEETGQLGPTLYSMGQTLSRRMESLSQYGVRILEPLLILLVGSFLGGMMLALFIPMFRLIQGM